MKAYLMNGKSLSSSASVYGTKTSNAGGLDVMVDSAVSNVSTPVMASSMASLRARMDLKVVVRGEDGLPRGDEEEETMPPAEDHFLDWSLVLLEI